MASAANLLVFICAAGLVWWAGTRLAFYVGTIGDRTGMGQAFAGMLVLGGITTLPELASSLVAGVLGAPLLALGNIFGSIAFNMLLLAAADAALGRNALTSIIARPATLLQGVLGMVLLGVAAAAIASESAALGPVGYWSTLLFACCLAALVIARSYERRVVWVVAIPMPEMEPASDDECHDRLRILISRTAGLALLILVGGVALAESSRAIALQAGIGEGLVGLALLALATSLPELSTIIGAMRRRRYELAVGDVFGANLFNVAMIFLVDLLAPGPPVLSVAGRFEIVAALLALILTGVFVIGLLERRNHTFLRMGYDSIAALLIYAAGLAYLTTVSA